MSLNAHFFVIIVVIWFVYLFYLFIYFLSRQHFRAWDHDKNEFSAGAYQNLAFLSVPFFFSQRYSETKAGSTKRHFNTYRHTALWITQGCLSVPSVALQDNRGEKNQSGNAFLNNRRNSQEAHTHTQKPKVNIWMLNFRWIFNYCLACVAYLLPVQPDLCCIIASNVALPAHIFYLITSEFLIKSWFLYGSWVNHHWNEGREHCFTIVFQAMSAVLFCIPCMASLSII